MVNLMNPSTPSGGAGKIAKTAVRDTGSVAYVGLIAAVGLTAAAFVFTRGRSFVAGKQATEAPAQPMQLFQVA